MTEIHAYTFSNTDPSENDLNMENFISKNDIQREDIVKIYFYATVTPRLHGSEDVDQNIKHFSKLVFVSEKITDDINQDDVKND